MTKKFTYIISVLLLVCGCKSFEKKRDSDFLFLSKIVVHQSQASSEGDIRKVPIDLTIVSFCRKEVRVKSLYLSSLPLKMVYLSGDGVYWKINPLNPDRTYSFIGDDFSVLKAGQETTLKLSLYCSDPVLIRVNSDPPVFLSSKPGYRFLYGESIPDEKDGHYGREVSIVGGGEAIVD